MSTAAFIALPVCLVAYLMGSIPFAVLSARLFHLSDPRTYGSGNPGATNVLRSGNRKAALVTLLGDTLKGALVILLCRMLGLPEWLTGLAALTAFFGHIFPLFLHFRGGKGVATAGGCLLALEPWVGLLALATWIAVAVGLRYSSLAAICAGLGAPIYSFLIYGFGGQFLIALVMGATLIVKHRTNLQRLVAGTEAKIR
ncbi:MAG: glycerol-3-phosphate 1-O-acyltransferase PlsY [Zoogloeaceae bacterium]|jgi:glycerol-3-phosphate acyltransferase PlsY|nr:glycerol-3-phosphate 1-O-acyltransferase PlsY [Zoogloeaceae bacterium]